jgi:hypothetical protein
MLGLPDGAFGHTWSAGLAARVAIRTFEPVPGTATIPDEVEAEVEVESRWRDQHDPGFAAEERKERKEKRQETSSAFIDCDLPAAWRTMSHSCLACASACALTA